MKGQTNELRQSERWLDAAFHLRGFHSDVKGHQDYLQEMPVGSLDRSSDLLSPQGLQMAPTKSAR